MGIGTAVVLAGCGAAPTGSGGDPAAAALGSAEVSTTSLDAPAGGDAGAATDPLATAALDPTTPGLSEPELLAPERKGLFGFLKPKPKQPPAGDDVTLVPPDPVAGDIGALPAPGAAALADAPAGESTAIDPAMADPAMADPAMADPAMADATATEAAPVRQRKGLFGFLRAKPAGDGATTTAATPTRPSVRMVDRDVEAPDVFQVSDSGLWDGRPSLGGVWVAYSEVTDPERVIIRNTDTGAFVIGALFRRERENPGPRLQVSSDAADALGMLAGSPARLNVTALRREEAVDPANAEALLGTGETNAATTVDPVAASAAAAIDAAEPSARQPAPRPASDAAAAGDALSAAAATAQPAAKPAASSGKSFLQVGIFSVEDNAIGTAKQLQSAGLTARVIKESSQGKTYWRVIAGPASSSADRDALLAKARGLGFGDAYFVSG